MITRVLFFGKRPLTPIGIEMTNPNPTILQKVTIHFSNEVAQTDIYKSGKLFYRVGEGMVPENEHQPIV